MKNCGGYIYAYKSFMKMSHYLFMIILAVSWGNASQGDPGVDYNEQFRWEEAGAIQDWYKAGLEKGLPYPVMSVAEHFAVQHEGFEWGAKYRAAGYTTSTLLW